MAYQALYRKWRPNTFADVVGQDAITNTLKNSIRINKISHAFLFAGPRGTGKTSCAKIFAKAVNCLNIQDGEPCNECANCLAANEGRMNDLIEIDAASNNGVDEIRDIRDKVKYAPTEGKYKVYIIDEVHMLSMGAFNALLKTLEEPPEHVIFILATTELQKVPATIISRTQKYTFKQISTANIIDRLTFILNAEGVKYEGRAIQVIAKVADGGMRDALSILDQIISFENNEVTYDDALEITGYASQEKIETLFLQLNQTDTTEALQSVKELLEDGANPKNVLMEIIDLSTESLVYLKTNTGLEEFLLEDFATKIANVEVPTILRVIELANDALNDLRFTNQQNIPLDVFCVKATSPLEVNEANNSNSTSNGSSIDNDQITALVAKVAQLEKQIKQISSGAQVNAAARTNVPTHKKATKSPQLEAKYRNGVFKVLSTATKSALNEVKDVWPDLMSKLEVSQRAMMDVSSPVAAGPDACVVAFDYQLWFERATSDSTFVNQLTDSLAVLTKKNIELVLVPQQDWPILRQEYLDLHRNEVKKNAVSGSDAEKTPEEPAENAIISKARDLFGDDMIDIKD